MSERWKILGARNQSHILPLQKRRATSYGARSLRQKPKIQASMIATRIDRFHKKGKPLSAQSPTHSTIKTSTKLLSPAVHPKATSTSVLTKWNKFRAPKYQSHHRCTTTTTYCFGKLIASSDSSGYATSQYSCQSVLSSEEGLTSVLSGESWESWVGNPSKADSLLLVSSRKRRPRLRGGSLAQG